MERQANIGHWDEVAWRRIDRGELQGERRRLGPHVGTSEVGLSRYRLGPGERAMPAHVHADEEELFFVLAGAGLAWLDGVTHELRAGDGIVHRANAEAHTWVAGPEGIDVLAFGEGSRTHMTYLPRAQAWWMGPRWMPADGPNPFVLEAAAGPLELPPEPSPRPATIRNVDELPVEAETKGRYGWHMRDLGRGTGSVTSGLRHDDDGVGFWDSRSGADQVTRSDHLRQHARVRPIEQLDAAYTERTKALLFVSPDNPSGSVSSPEMVKAVGEWALDKGVWVITDEIYEHLTYGDHQFVSMPTVVPELANQCIIVNGVAKTYAMTGWRVGWMIGPDDIIKASTNFQSHATSNVANVSQRAALAAVSGSLDDVAMMRTAFARRAQTMYTMLNAIDGVTCLEPQGAFYAYPDLTGLLNRPIDGVTATNTLELADLVLDKAKVAFVPGEAFGLGGYGRFSFALGDDDLAEGMARFAALVG